MSYQSDNMAFNNAMDSIAHYGVLGMKWGVRNDETLRKYRGSSGGYILEKGYDIRRISSRKETKQGTDLSRPFYASQNQRDFDIYKTATDWLPSTSNGDKKIGIQTFEAIDDVKVARGSDVLNKILKEYGDTPLSMLFDDYGYATDRKELGLNETETVNSAIKKKKYTEDAKRIATRRLAAEVLGSRNEDSANVKVYGKDSRAIGIGSKLIDEYRDIGYDAIEDIEDQLSDWKVDSPLLVINGDKFKIVDKQIVKRSKL